MIRANTIPPRVPRTVWAGPIDWPKSQFEVTRREHLALNDREVDLDLVEPTRVKRRMHQNDVRPSGTQAISGVPAAMAGAVVCDQEDPSADR